jgi:hypothetical protein
MGDTIMADDTTSSENMLWSHQGWFEKATAWIQEQLRHLNYTVVDDIKQVYVSPTSCVLSVATTSGDIYFKACAPLFKYEPLLTQTISQLLSAYTMRVLNVDNERYWLLMEDAGLSLRKLTLERRDLKRWEASLSLFARFQMESISCNAQLKVAGCPDRTLARIPDLFDTLLMDTSALLVDQKNGVPGSEMEQLRAFKPQLSALCAELASYNIPEALHHDDLTANNIALSARGYIFFDWAESAITHPFCSLFIPLRVAQYVFAFSENELTGIRNSYLYQWVAYQPMERLQRAFELAQRLAILCRCLTWHYVITHIEEHAKAEFQDSTPYWLRLFLHNGEEIAEDAN